MQTVVGKPYPRLDAVEKVTGRAKYGYDFEVPRMLYARILRSPHPHARVVKIDTSDAERVPGVAAVITSKDTGNRLRGTGLNDTPTLAFDRVRYVGEPVAAVAAGDPRTAQKALDLIRVEYEVLASLTDPEVAMQHNPPIVLHPDLYNYGGAYAFGPKPDRSRPNVCASFRIVSGDVDRAFREADTVVESKFTTSMAQHAQMEPITCVAEWKQDGTLTLWQPTQSPFRTRQELSYALGIPTSRIRVICPLMGAGFGVKLSSHVGPIAAFLSKKTRRPVKIVLNREEDFAATLVRHPFIIRIKDGVKKDGTLIARQMSMILDGGAYSGGSGVHVTKICALTAIAGYRIPNVKIESNRVYTNHVPGGAFRGFGALQVVWAIECQMDIIAKKIGMDPVEFRLKNLYDDGDITPIGEKILSISHKEALRRVAEEFRATPNDVATNSGWRRGKAVVALYKPSHAPTASSALVKVDDDENIGVWTSTSDMGVGSNTVLAQIAAEVLTLPVDKARVFPPDTLLTPFSDGGFSSRQTYEDGNAVRLAALDVKRQILERAAEILDEELGELDLQGGWIVSRKGISKKLRIRDLFVRDQTRYGAFLPEGEFIGKASWHQKAGVLDPDTGKCETQRAQAFYMSGAAGAEVEVNSETGEVRVTRIVMAADVGKAINPLLVQSQIEGGVIMGLGTALYEQMVLDKGRIMNPNYLKYCVPTAAELPEITSIIIEKPHPDGPFGAKGVGELPTLGPPPAVANAVCNAINARIFDLPLTPDKILSASSKVDEVQ